MPSPRRRPMHFVRVLSFLCVIAGVVPDQRRNDCRSVYFIRLSFIIPRNRTRSIRAPGAACETIAKRSRTPERKCRRSTMRFPGRPVCRCARENSFLTCIAIARKKKTDVAEKKNGRRTMPSAAAGFRVTSPTISGSPTPALSK